MSLKMDAVKVILSMFVVLFHAGLTHEKPHNGINPKVINNTATFNHTIDAIDNRSDPINNTSEAFHNSTGVNNITDKIDKTNQSMILITDTFNNRSDPISNASEATYNSTNAINKTDTDNNTNEDFNKIDAFNNEMKTIANADEFSTDEELDKIINPLVHETGDMLDRLDIILHQVDKLTDIANNFIAIIHILNQIKGSVTTETTTEAATPLNTSCVTSFKEVGGCFPRKYCNYGTGAVDLTLYAKAGYQRICKGADLVCCPIRSQLPMTTEKKTDDDDFGSDEDDF